jgi:ABC-type transporter Mla MlaB component
MVIHISATAQVTRTVVKVDGKLRAEDVAELARVFGVVQGSTELDLSELTSADRAGVAALRELVSRGALVRGASPYIELLLKTGQH